MKAHATCNHLHVKTYTGFYLNIADLDHLWVACCKCGSVVRSAPAFTRDEEEFKAGKGNQAS